MNSLRNINNRNIRLIARLDIKGDKLIKGVHLEGLRQVGLPNNFALQYYNSLIDEIIYIDVVASLYQRSIKAELVKEASKDIYVPLTVGGGIRSLDDADILYKSGADKIVLNTAAVANPLLVSELVEKYGSQAVICSIEAKKITENTWEVYTESGRQKTNISVLEWAKNMEKIGVGEILLTSIDREGTRSGFDEKLAYLICNAVDLPVIISGGFGSLNHLSPVLKAGVDGIAIADALHYNKFSIIEIKKKILELGYDVRVNE